MLDWLHFASTWRTWASESELPQRIVSGVYVLLDLASSPVYVGQSSDIARRLEEHRQGTTSTARGYETPAKDFHRALFFPVSSNSDRLRLEGILILALAPLLNRALFLRLSRDEETGEAKVSQFDPRAAKQSAGRRLKATRRCVEESVRDLTARDSELLARRARHPRRRGASRRVDDGQ